MAALEALEQSYLFTLHKSTRAMTLLPHHDERSDADHRWPQRFPALGIAHDDFIGILERAVQPAGTVDLVKESSGFRRMNAKRFGGTTFGDEPLKTGWCWQTEAKRLLSPQRHAQNHDRPWHDDQVFSGRRYWSHVDAVALIQSAIQPSTWPPTLDIFSTKLRETGNNYLGAHRSTVG